MCAYQANVDVGATTTLERHQKGQKRAINEQFSPPFSPITFPARPLQGGKLHLAPKKTGLWYAEPKYNGWRALVHCPSGVMWNRRGGVLGISAEFAGPLKQLRDLGIVWADCEAMERRHDVGRGSLIVLDYVPLECSPSYQERRSLLESILPLEQMSQGDAAIPRGSLLLATSFADEDGTAMSLYRSLEEINRRFKTDVFEGVVMKRAGSVYPVQLRSPNEETRTWVKHRFLV